jgi:hypothetical protein
MRSFDRWRALTATEQSLTVKSAVLIAGAAASLRLLGLERTLRLASLDRMPAPRAHETSKNVIATLASAADRAERYVPGGSCLSKSVALAWMLRREGVDAAVRIGVSTAGGFEAHAWVEASGLESERPARFTPLEL